MKRGGEMRFLSANGHVTDRRPPSVSADSRQEEDSEQYRQHEYMHTHIKHTHTTDMTKYPQSKTTCM